MRAVSTFISEVSRLKFNTVGNLHLLVPRRKSRRSFIFLSFLETSGSYCCHLYSLNDKRSLTVKHLPYT